MSFDLGAMLKDVSNLDTGREQIEYIRLDQIDADPNNFYQIGGIEDLAANIALCGLQQPIRVRQNQEDPGRYITVSGHRRRAALEQLAKDDPERWTEIPCIVERDAVSPALQQLRLIYANANTRTMTSAELGEQAAQVEKLLYQLKEEGYEFPGRMRDHVAEAVNTSKTKLARIKVIRSNLIPQFMALWNADKLRESVAYSLAGQTPVRQKAVWIAQTNDGKCSFPCTDSHLQAIFREMDRMETICAKPCEVNHTDKCDHVYCRVNHAAGLAPYLGMVCHGCCISCFNLESCTYYCEYASDKRKELKDSAKAVKKQAAELKKEKEQPEKDLMAEAYRHVVQLREQCGVSQQEFLKVSLGYAYPHDLDNLVKQEQGKTNIGWRMPGGIWSSEAMRLIATADLLGCSIDYLLGRDVPTSDAAPAKENVSNLDTGWRTGTPPEPGNYAVYVSAAGIIYADEFKWNGSVWFCGGSPIDDDDDVFAWTYPPKMETM